MIENERENLISKIGRKFYIFGLLVNKKRFKKVLIKSTQGSICNFKDILTSTDLKKDKNNSILRE